jgi:hypothetical protein
MWISRIGIDLAASGADQDEEVLASARQVLLLLEQSQEQPSKYTMDLREAKGVQVGDQNIQHNTFS